MLTSNWEGNIGEDETLQAGKLSLKAPRGKTAPPFVFL